jgi:hypothetical protein
VGARAALDGVHVGDLPHTAMVLASTSAGGPPNLALLSRGEVLAIADDRLRVALHAGSRTSANLAATGQATLLLADEQAVETIALRARPLAPVTIAGRDLALFEALVIETRAHAVPYAMLTSGIAFELADEQATVSRWRATIDALRHAEQAR